MSFTTNIKNEISKLETSEAENISELSAIIRNIGKIDDSIKIYTENSSIARRVFLNLKNLYNITPSITVRKGYNFSKKYLYIISIKNKKNQIINDLSIDTSIPKNFIIADEELIRAYLRGLFMAIGSINDPKKSRYHLELLFENIDYANFIKELFDMYDLKAKIIKRDNKYMLYIKEAEKIGDFLRIINAITSLFYFEDIRIYRDHKNMTNRLNNCEQANVDKIIMTSAQQIKDIDKIKSEDKYDLLEDKLKVVCEYRIKYPDASLKELSEIISIETGNKITKSGLSHRFEKIKYIANK